MIALQVVTILLVLIGFIHQRKFIMSQATDTRDAVKAATAKILASFSGISGDLKALKAKIDALPGNTAEDQEALQEIKNDINDLVDRAAALDAETPDEVPPAA